VYIVVDALLPHSLFPGPTPLFLSYNSSTRKTLFFFAVPSTTSRARWSSSSPRKMRSEIPSSLEPSRRTRWRGTRSRIYDSSTFCSSRRACGFKNGHVLQIPLAKPRDSCSGIEITSGFDSQMINAAQFVEEWQDCK
jgi:hypothetical protein